ncbi:PBP1A family penicillin-binding protein [Frigidibacter albus]|uniref:peptidoglycan glycosyltransferase n=1 Tax=Frigidibacter albus TaxID=1465486 RepID=A0A6L8VC77_9RHOB|nr:PBP1A family penicillin-binding protein [Frigidibacter albus]MZQ87905.1 PBP1A family penicillin-binding protein [Frigidibacter albus]NBE29811.1 PBP1A family penicillin-binding protein [Frigidibacter albus]
MTGSGGKKPPLVADRRYGAVRGTAKKPAAKPAAKAPAKPAAQSARTRAPARRRSSNPIVRLIGGLFRGIWRTIWGIGWRVTALVAAGLGIVTWYLYTQLPPVDSLLDARARGSVTMLDNSDQVFAWRGETFGGQVTSDTVSEHLRNAVIATEDKRFYQHFGLSPRGIASAIRINLSEGRGALEGNGGSTITQQVAKLLCLGVPYDASQWESEAAYEADCRASSVWRKLKEVPFSMAMEAKYGKADVLTIYLNRAYLGAGARGFEAAAQRYFGKSAANVTPAEAAMLAGLLKAPSRYAPTANLQRSQERANLIIGLMEDQGYLTKAEADDARANPARLSEAAAQQAGGYFADWIMESGPDFLTRDTTEDVIIRTTLDKRLQAAAEGALAYVFETKLKEGSKAQAAIVVMSADGAVRAMVGGRNTAAAGSFNRATQAKRQTGSTFKPFVYAAALEMGYPPSSTVMDEPLTINIPGSGPWSPQNYEKGKYRGQIDLLTALAQSVNTSTVRIQEAVGRDLVRKIATDLGFAHDLADGPALALGASESTLIEMTGAYAGFLNGGTAVKPYGILELRLKGDEVPLMGQDGGFGQRVISETAARQLVYMMSQVIDRGTGGRANLGDRPAAGKTGTTSAARDAWFIGFTADYVAGVWMGYDDNTPLSGVTGGGLPAEIWREVMVRVHEGLPVHELPMDLPTEAYGQAPDTPAPDQQPVPGAEWQAQTAPLPQQQPQPQRQREPDVAEQILMEVLGGILGRN